MITLPDPDCEYGYTSAQVEQIIGPARLDAFNAWMYGQTIMLCDGQPPCTRPHGAIVYTQDLRQYLAGGAPLD